jgi:hypothetical protein
MSPETGSSSGFAEAGSRRIGTACVYTSNSRRKAHRALERYLVNGHWSARYARRAVRQKGIVPFLARAFALISAWRANALLLQVRITTLPNFSGAQNIAAHETEARGRPDCLNVVSLTVGDVPPPELEVGCPSAMQTLHRDKHQPWRKMCSNVSNRSRDVTTHVGNEAKDI